MEAMEGSGGETFTNDTIKQSVEVGKLASRLHGGQLRVKLKMVHKANATCAGSREL